MGNMWPVKQSIYQQYRLKFQVRILKNTTLGFSLFILILNCTLQIWIHVNELQTDKNWGTMRSHSLKLNDELKKQNNDHCIPEKTKFQYKT